MPQRLTLLWGKRTDMPAHAATGVWDVAFAQLMLIPMVMVVILLKLVVIPMLLVLVLLGLLTADAAADAAGCWCCWCSEFVSCVTKAVF